MPETRSGGGREAPARDASDGASRDGPEAVEAPLGAGATHGSRMSDFRPVGVDHALDELEEQVASTTLQTTASSGAAGPASAHPLTLDERESIPMENASTSLHTVAGASSHPTGRRGMARRPWRHRSEQVPRRGCGQPSLKARDGGT